MYTTCCHISSKVNYIIYLHIWSRLQKSEPEPNSIIMRTYTVYRYLLCIGRQLNFLFRYRFVYRYSQEAFYHQESYEEISVPVIFSIFHNLSRIFMSFLDFLWFFTFFHDLLRFVRNFSRFLRNHGCVPRQIRGTQNTSIRVRYLYRYKGTQ